jgi:hypothetical protein
VAKSAIGKSRPGGIYESKVKRQVPVMSTTSHSKPQAVMVGRVAKVKSLEPITSTCAPSPADVIEYSEKKIMLRVHRYMNMGTIVQLHLDGAFSLWRVFCCIATGDTFHLGLELVELVSTAG